MIGLFLFVFLFTVAVLPQQEESANTNSASEKAVEDVPEVTDKEAFAKAIAVNDPFEKINAINAFVTDFPESDLREKALESLSSARATAADIRLRAGQREDGLGLFSL
ncbi:MAG: hypothetical protein OEQ28_16845, partial [Acidobacteriota bacterium]|nr:hypothetical protein [Acidobacteriota bacterium]